MYGYKVNSTQVITQNRIYVCDLHLKLVKLAQQKKSMSKVDIDFSQTPFDFHDFISEFPLLHTFSPWLPHPLA